MWWWATACKMILAQFKFGQKKKWSETLQKFIFYKKKEGQRV